MEMSEFNEISKVEFSARINLALDNLGVPVRARAQWVQGKLSFKISVNGIKKWLEGDSLPSSARYEEIARVCQVSTMWLMSGKESAEFSDQDYDSLLNAIITVVNNLPEGEAKAKKMEAIHRLSQ